MGKLNERRSRPGATPEEREKQIIALAYDAVEERIRNGKATSQELCHFLKLGQANTRLETEKLNCEVELLKAKTEAINEQKELTEVYSRAMKAFGIYQGKEDDEEDEDYDDYYPDVY